MLRALATIRATSSAARMTRPAGGSAGRSARRGLCRSRGPSGPRSPDRGHRRGSVSRAVRKNARAALGAGLGVGGDPGPGRRPTPGNQSRSIARSAAKPRHRGQARSRSVVVLTRGSSPGISEGQAWLASSSRGFAAFRSGSPGTARPTPPPVSRTTCSVRAAPGFFGVWSPTGTPERSVPFATSNARPSGLCVSLDVVTGIGLGALP